MSTQQKITAVQPTATEEENEDDPDAVEFKNQRMENAYYWAAQLRAFMNKHTTATEGDEYYVEIMAGKPILVVDLDFEWGIDALTSAWVDEGFPTEEGAWNAKPAWNKRKLSADKCGWSDNGGEIRCFVEPSDERLQAPFVPLDQIDKSSFTGQSFD